MSKKEYVFPSEYSSKFPKKTAVAVMHLGKLGKMISASKGRYSFEKPTNLVIFNANVFVENEGEVAKVWYGDIDLTEDIENVLSFALDIKQKVYVFYEKDGRFENESSPNIDEAALTVEPTGSFSLKESEFLYIDENGTPRLLTLEQHKAKFPEKYKKAEIFIEYKKEDFEAYKIDLNKFSSVSKAKGSPIELFQKYLINDLGKEKAQEIYLSLHWTKEQDEYFNELLVQFMKKALKIKDEYDIQQTLAFESLDLPIVFVKTPKWAKKGYIYIRKTGDEA